MRLTKRSRLTIAEIADVALEYLPMTFANSDVTPGRKVFFPIPLKKEPRDMWDFIYIYAESKLTHKPLNDEFGFTADDVISDSGVYVFKKVFGRISGVTYPITGLFGEVIKDLSLQNRIIYRINEMKQMVQLDDDFLDAVNNQWVLSKNAENFGIKRLN